MSQRSATVLVIEDNPVTRKLVRATLDSEGYLVVEAADGDAARGALARALPDLVLLDLVLPDVSGFQLLREIREIPGGTAIPVLAFTGLLPRDDEARAAAAGFTEFLVKPVEPSRLIATIRAYLRAPAEVSRTSRAKRVLVVDDDPVQLKLARAHLEHAGFEVETAPDGEAALAAARGRPPDAILADVLMPRLDGFRLCRAVRQDPALHAIPVVLQSHQYIDESDRALARRLGANAYLARTPDLRQAADALVVALDQPPPGSDDAVIDETYSRYLDRVVRQLERQAIRNAELSQQNAMQAAALTVLGTTANALARRHGIDEILHDTLYRCIDAAGLSVGVFYVVEGEAAFRAHTVVGYRQTPGSPVETCFGHPELLRRTLSSPEPLLMPADEPDVVSRDFLDRVGLNAALLVPVRFGAEPLGVLLFASNSASGSPLRWVEFARVVSGQVGQAVALGRAFDRVQHSEERYRLLFETNPLPSWVFDRETLQILAVNDAAVTHYGYTREEFLGLTIRDLRPPEDVPLIEQRVRHAPAGPHMAGTWRHRKRDGALILVEVSAHGLVYAGRPAELVVVHDVTEERRTSAVVREREERFRQLVENMREVFFVESADLREMIYISPSYEEIWGRSCQSLYDDPRSFLEPVPEEDRERLFANIAQAQAGEQPDEIEFRVAHPDGRVRWVLARSGPVRNELGEVYRIAGVALDITERKQAEAALRLNEERFRALVENSGDAVAVLERDGTISYLSQSSVRVLGFESRDLLGTNAFALLHPDDVAAVRESIQALRDSPGGVVQVASRFRHRDGEWHYGEGSLTNRLHDAVVRGVVFNFRDVTSQRQLEEQFRQSQKMEAVGKLAGGVAHDFNNLLTVITSYGQLLMEDLPMGDPRRADLDEIQKAATAAAGLTRQLLAFSRQQVLEPRVLDLNEVVDAAGKMLKRLIGEDIDLITVPAADLWVVRADPGQIEQVLLNLAVNARDAMPMGGKLTIETANVDLAGTYIGHHRPVTPGPYVLLAVSDTGSGMDRETQTHIFEPFFTTKEKGKGTGLGLATVYGIVKQSGGFIWFYSEPGQGTTFKIYLPRVEEERSVTSAPPSAPTIQGSETILLVEDATPVREVARAVLSRCGYAVVVAGDGRAALEAAARHSGPIHLLVTDVIMPEIGGRQLADRLLELHPGLRVLFVSGYTDDAIIRHGILEPGIAFLQKPFTPESLAAKVREVLDSPPSPR
jgi:PAS domain S-box-containing protein